MKFLDDMLVNFYQSIYDFNKIYKSFALKICV